MGIEPKDVDYVARLARLHLDDDERERMRAELDTILGHASEIQALDLVGVEPTSHAVALPSALRPDDVKPSLTQEQALSGAPAVEAGRFRVPRIIEEA